MIVENESVNLHHILVAIPQVIILTIGLEMIVENESVNLHHILVAKEFRIIRKRKVGYDVTNTSLECRNKLEFCVF